MISYITKQAQFSISKTWCSLSFALLLLLLTACGSGGSGDGDVVNTVELPNTDSVAKALYCDDVGVFTESCILDDPANPYAGSPISEAGKFALDADAPSAEARFYLWGTALASRVGAGGENQFYTALYLHRLWALNGSEAYRLQALKAYRSYLDNYFDGASFFEIPVGSGNTFRQLINPWVGQLLVDPTNAGNVFTSAPLFSPDPNINRTQANLLLSEWGYNYNEALEFFSN